MEGCKQREVAAAAPGAGAVVDVRGDCQGNGCSPSSPGKQLLCHPANWWSCSGEGGWRVGPGTVVGGQSVATEKEEWTEPCPGVCLPFLFCLFLS